MALTIPESNSVDRSSKALRLSREKINQIVTILTQFGLVAECNGKLERRSLTLLYPSDPADAKEILTFSMACTPKK